MLLHLRISSACRHYCVLAADARVHAQVCVLAYLIGKEHPIRKAIYTFSLLLLPHTSPNPGGFDVLVASTQRLQSSSVCNFQRLQPVSGFNTRLQIPSGIELPAVSNFQQLHTSSGSNCRRPYPLNSFTKAQLLQTRGILPTSTHKTALPTSLQYRS